MIEKLESVVEKYREFLKSHNGSPCIFSEDGPAHMSLIYKIVEVLKDQQRQIDELEKRLIVQK